MSTNSIDGVSPVGESHYQKQPEAANNSAVDTFSNEMKGAGSEQQAVMSIQQGMNGTFDGQNKFTLEDPSMVLVANHNDGSRLTMRASDGSKAIVDFPGQPNMTLEDVKTRLEVTNPAHAGEAEQGCSSDAGASAEGGCSSGGGAEESFEDWLRKLAEKLGIDPKELEKMLQESGAIGKDGKLDVGKLKEVLMEKGMGEEEAVTTANKAKEAFGDEPLQGVAESDSSQET